MPSATLAPCIELNQSQILGKTAFVTLSFKLHFGVYLESDNFGVFIYTSDPFVVILMKT